MKSNECINAFGDKNCLTNIPNSQTPNYKKQVRSRRSALPESGDGEEEQATTGAGAAEQDGRTAQPEQRQRSGRRKQKGENGEKNPSRENLTQPIVAVRNDYI